MDLDRFSSLGVITDKVISERTAVAELIRTLENAFESKKCTKEDIIKLISRYLPNFEHIETGKSLDSKM